MVPHPARIARNVPDTAHAGIVSGAALSYTVLDSHGCVFSLLALSRESGPPDLELNFEPEGMRLCGQVARVNRAGEA